MLKKLEWLKAWLADPHAPEFCDSDPAGVIDDIVKHAEDIRDSVGSAVRLAQIARRFLSESERASSHWDVFENRIENVSRRLNE